MADIGGPSRMECEGLEGATTLFRTNVITPKSIVEYAPKFERLGRVRFREKRRLTGPQHVRALNPVCLTTLRASGIVIANSDAGRTKDVRLCIGRSTGHREGEMTNMGSSKLCL